MKYKVVKINENDLRDIIKESLNSISKSDKQINEIFGINHRLRGAFVDFRQGMRNYNNRNIVMSTWNPNNVQPSSYDDEEEMTVNNVNTNTDTNNGDNRNNTDTNNDGTNILNPNISNNNNIVTNVSSNSTMNSEQIHEFINKFNQCYYLIKANDIQNGTEYLRELINYLQQYS